MIHTKPSKHVKTAFKMNEGGRKLYLHKAYVRSN
jgi:hypothetical protein